MIITCNNCSKKFEINSDLIPDKGRLLQCSGCNYKWFFQQSLSPANKKELEVYDVDKNVVIPTIKKDNLKDKTDEFSNNEETLIPKDTENLIVQAESSLKSKKNNVKKSKLLTYIIIFIISFTAFIILIDTFKYSISKIIPNVEFILYNLYETIKDITLFFKDLI